MKYVVVLGDGMADVPMEELGQKTVLDYAKTPMMDELASKGEIGMVHTIPQGMKPGSDTANLSVLGYDPRKYYSGRSPLEALSIGVQMEEDDIAIRCNIVTLSEEETEYENRRMIDHSASEISTEEAAVLLKAVADELETEYGHFYVGTSYRHCYILNHGQVMDLVPPHDILEQGILEHLPKDELLLDIMKKSYDILVNHPINIERKKKGLHPANSCWFWGAGTKPSLISFKEKTGLEGAMISAVDLLKGIAVGTSMKVIEVEGATGGLETNYEGKAQAAISALTEGNCDFVYVHLEGPDEMGHQGNKDHKIQAIENLDQRIIKPIVEGLTARGEEFGMLILPDHPTPICLRTHTSDDVPYLLFDSRKDHKNPLRYTEEQGRLAAKDERFYVADGYQLIDRLFGLG